MLYLDESYLLNPILEAISIKLNQQKTQMNKTVEMPFSKNICLKLSNSKLALSCTNHSTQAQSLKRLQMKYSGWSLTFVWKAVQKVGILKILSNSQSDKWNII